MPTSPLQEHTVLYQSSPGRSTTLMHDYRLPSGLDVIRRPKHRRSALANKRPAGLKKQSSSYSVNSDLSSDHRSNTAVYIKDAAYVWLPAQIQSSTDERAMVKIVVPDDWAQTTIMSEKSSITELEFQTTSSGFGSYTSPKFGQSENAMGKQQKQKCYSYERDPGDFDRSMQKGVKRTLSLMDYPNAEFPLQNTDRRAQRLLSSKNRVQKNTIYHPLVNARDMADLHFLHEAAILYNLKQRHGNKLPYTRVGDIVVAVNPFQWIDGMYSSEKQAMYAKHLIWDAKDFEDDDGQIDQEDVSELGNISDDENDSFGQLGSMPPLTPSGKLIKFRKDNSNAKGNDAPPSERHEPMSHGSIYSKLGLEPHVYENASLAYRGLASDRKNQTILVSGESGAGKTETVKIVMSNLATIEQTRPFYHPPGKGLFGRGDQMNRVVKQVLESNPVFEAFGCAKTVRNDNSSRFGRFTQLQYEVESRREAELHSRKALPTCLLQGSYCATYLLEKSRVVGHAAGEQTYHIFYQLLSAPNNEKALIWDGLVGTNNNNFAYIGNASTSAIEGKSDIESWQSTIKALKLFGFSGESLRQLLRALCVVLQLGNLTFAASQSSEAGSIISSSAELTELSKLIGVAENDLAQAMTTRVNHIRGEEVVSRPNIKEAKEGCDALAKSVYACIFDRLVKQINDHTSVGSDQHSISKGSIGTISLLDIFGFEHFEVNRFEQLCINFSNERLQHRYVLDNFRAVKEEYTAEGIDIFDFSMVDNSGVIELFECKLGLIASLNEECVRPQGKASSFVYKIKMLHNESKHLLVDRLQKECEFGIRHFAGAVTYDANEFLKSNVDLTPKDLLQCACRSSNSLIREEFKTIVSSLEKTGRGPPRRASAKTVMAKFRSQLNSLMSCIEETKTRYIRCIKPNTEMTPGKLNHRETMNQLESAGLVTAITISRETFPNRLPYDVIWERFECLDHEYRLRRPSFDQMREEELKSNVESLLKSLLLKPFKRADGARVPSFCCGRTKVYFRTGALEHLESDRMEYYSFYAAKIGNWYRSAMARVKFVRIKNAAIALQAQARKMTAQNRYKSTRQAVVAIQSICRMVRARRSLTLLRQSAIEIQTIQRMVSSRRKFRVVLVSVLLLQSAFRATIVKVRYSRMLTSAIKIQSYWRRLVAREDTIELIKRRIKEYECATQIQSWYRSQSSRIKTKCNVRDRFSLRNSSISIDHNQERAISSSMANNSGTSHQEASYDIVQVDGRQNAIDAEELHRLRDEVVTLKNENIGLMSEVQEYNEEITIISQRNISLEQEQKMQCDTQMKQLKILEDTVNCMKEEKNLLEEQILNHDTKLESIQDQCDKVSEEKIRKESELVDLKGAVKSLEYEYAIAKDNLNDYQGRISSLEEEVVVRKVKIEEMDTFNNSMKAQMHDKDSLSVKLEDRIASLESEHDEMDSELKNSYDEVNNFRSRFKDLETEAEEMNNELEKSYSEVNTMKSRIEFLEIEADDVHSELETAYGEVHSLKNQVLALLKEIEVRDGELKSSASHINSLEDSNSKLKLDIEYAEEKFQKTTSILEERASLFEESIESQQNAIVILKKANLSGEIECQTLVQELLTLQQEIQSYEDAATLYQQNILGLEKETKEMTISSRANLTRIANAENDISSLSQKVKNRDKKLQDLEDRNSSLQITISALEREGGDLTEQLNTMAIEKKSLFERIEQSTGKEKELNKAIEFLVGQRDDVDAEASKLRDEIGGLRETLTQEKKTNGERVEVLIKNASSLQQDIDFRSTTSDILHSEMKELMQQQEKTTKDLESSQDAIKQCEEDMETLRNQLRIRDDQIACFTDELSVLKQDLEAGDNEIDAQKDRLESELVQAQEATKAAETETELLRELAETLRSTVETYEFQSSDMTAEIANLRGHIDFLQEEVNVKRDDHDEDVESLRKQLEISLEQNSSIRREFEELEANKIELMNHVQSLMVTNKSATKRAQSLLETNKTLLAEMSTSKTSKTKYERMVYDHDIEIMELKELLADALRGRERFAQNVDMKMQQERDIMLSEIHVLKAKLRNAQQKSDDYNQKIINVLQTAHSTREAEVRKLKKAVKRLTQDLGRANSVTSTSVSSLTQRHRFEQTRGYLQVFQSERQRKLFELLSCLKTLSLQSGSSFRDNLLQTIINSMEELCKSEELESTKILSTLSTFDET